MKQIVCLSTSSWRPFPTRKQQVMSRLTDCEILYFDPPVSLIAPLKDRSLREKLSAWKREGEKIGENITVYSMPPVIPFFNKFRIINKLNSIRVSRFVRKKMKLHGFDAPVLWCYSPTASDSAGRIPHSALVYDCVDRHSSYKGLINPSVVDRMERDLCEKADFVFATANGLFETLSKYNPSCAMVPNGANFELFNRARDGDPPFPDDLFNIKNPIFGFVGTLQEWVEFSFIEEAAAAKPGWNFVLIGAAHPSVPLDGLKKLKNVHILGLKPYKELPNYTARFDVCLNLFRSGSLAKDVSPLKFYEYLATGKPIVSTPQPEQVLEYSGVCHIAGTPEQFIEKCGLALRESDPAMSEKRVEFGRACSWDSRVAEIRRILGERGILK